MEFSAIKLLNDILLLYDLSRHWQATTPLICSEGGGHGSKSTRSWNKNRNVKLLYKI